MVAMFIVCILKAPGTSLSSPIWLQGAIGVLDRTQMDQFASIFLAYQKRGNSEDSGGTLVESLLVLAIV